MRRLIVVTGGARSGKSAFAEDTAKKFGSNVLYIATAIPFDDEMKHRIAKHREQRPACWETLEAYKDFGRHLVDRLGGRSAVLLDCITILVSNLMFEKEMDWDRLKADDISGMEAYIKKEVEKLLEIAENSGTPFILVTNELGMGIVPENALARIFRDMAGRVNQMLAKAADEVYFCVSGIPVRIK